MDDENLAVRRDGTELDAVCTRLEHLGVLRIGGRDAAAFLQGQLSNDVRRLEHGEPLLAAYSSAQGRVIAILQLLPHSGGFLALLPRDLITRVRERLHRFVLRAKVEIEDSSDALLVLGAGLEALERAGLAPGGAYAEQDGIGIARVARDAVRHYVVGARTALEARGLTGDAYAQDDWRLADIRAGLPQIYAPTSELFVAQMLNLDLIDAISFTKGCYTGQEIIARTQHLGRIKRRMFRLGLPRAVAIGDTVALSDGRAGRVTECVQRGTICEALAVLPLEPGGAETGAQPALVGTLLPLPYALAPDSR